MRNNSNRIRIGYVPLVDCAPIIVAQESGIFARHDLNVDLQREPGWATIRDKLAYGELDVAHGLAGLAFALSWGLGVIKTPCVTGYLLNSNGDAITISKPLFEKGVTDASTLAIEIATFRREKPLTFAVPHLFSSHHFILRQWLRPHGIVPGRDIQIIVLPPFLMSACLKSGYIDGYCVGEPFNSQAHLHGSGIILAESANLSPLHPEKALIVSKEFSVTKESEHLSLIQAISEAAVYCETDKGRKNAANLLSSSEYLGIEPSLIRASLLPDERPRTGSLSSDSFHVFHHPEVNRPTKEKASWIINQMRSASLLDDIETKTLPNLKTIFRTDIYDQAIKESNPIAA